MKYCDTTRGNGWTTGNTNLILNPRDRNLLAASRNRPGWRVSLGNANSLPRYPGRSSHNARLRITTTEHHHEGHEEHRSTKFCVGRLAEMGSRAAPACGFTVN